MKRKLAGFLMLVFTVLALLPLAAQAECPSANDGQHSWTLIDDVQPWSSGSLH